MSIHATTSRLHAWLTTRAGRESLVVWTVVFMMSGQGFRYMLGIPGYALLCVLTLAAFWVAFRDSLWRARFPLIIVAFVALGGLSIVWSATPAVTALAFAVTAVTTALAAVSVQGVGGKRFLDLLYRGLQWCVLLGIGFEVFVTLVVQDELMPVAGDFSGVTGLDDSTSPFVWSENALLDGGPIQGFVGNRNPFGAIVLFTAILAVILRLERRISARNGWTTLLTCIGVHMLTQSATVTVVAGAVLLLAVFGVVIRAADPPGKRLISLSFIGMMTVAAFFALRHFDKILDLLDRDSDLTNRTGIWERVVDIAQMRPEGWGFVGVWPIWANPYSAVVDETTVRATHAHNSYLDAWLQLGVLGAVVLIAIVVLTMARAWRAVEYGRPHDTWMPLGWFLLLGALAVQSLAESKMLVEGGWFMLVALACIVPRMRAVTLAPPHRARTGAEWFPRYVAKRTAAPAERLGESGTERA
ncbi:O-antigen ligase family protein [Demequina globuliformis]|uniref:O-antigen ligase family protein n=1 Tax=Demequina globuliformis TaxID=676202 RepID=UPI000781FF0A|nr:O-antigen ligase family protein [Demequina globuliformis]